MAALDLGSTTRGRRSGDFNRDNVPRSEALFLLLLAGGTVAILKLYPFRSCLAHVGRAQSRVEAYSMSPHSLIFVLSEPLEDQV